MIPITAALIFLKSQTSRRLSAPPAAKCRSVLTHATILPPNCTGLEEEGVLINNIKLVSRGSFVEAETIALLSSSQYLARTPARTCPTSSPGCGQAERLRGIDQDCHAPWLAGAHGYMGSTDVTDTSMQSSKNFNASNIICVANSRLTDPEILKCRHPVRQESYAIRAGSGSAGQWHSGSLRKLRFLENTTASILSNNRLVPPFGAAGGEPGSCNHKKGGGLTSGRRRYASWRTRICILVTGSSLKRKAPDMANPLRGIRSGRS
jgi:hypothetical protein